MCNNMQERGNEGKRLVDVSVTIAWTYSQTQNKAQKLQKVQGELHAVALLVVNVVTQSRRPGEVVLISTFRHPRTPDMSAEGPPWTVWPISGYVSHHERNHVREIEKKAASSCQALVVGSVRVEHHAFRAARRCPACYGGWPTWTRLRNPDRLKMGLTMVTRLARVAAMVAGRRSGRLARLAAT